MVAGPAPIAMTGGGVMAAAPPGSAVGGFVRGKPLDNPVAGQHAPIDGKVPANHKCTHCGVLLSQVPRFVCEISLVLAAVHLNQASVAAASTVALICGIKPPTTPAKTFQILHIEAGHLVSCFQSRSRGQYGRPEWKRGTEVA